MKADKLAVPAEPTKDRAPAERWVVDPTARKGGKQHTIPCHHALAETLRAHIDAARLAEDGKGWLFRTSRGHDGTVLSEKPMGQPDAWRMIRKRAGGHRRGNLLSHIPGYRYHRLPRQRRSARARSGNGGTRESAEDKAL